MDINNEQKALINELTESVKEYSDTVQTEFKKINNIIQETNKFINDMNNGFKNDEVIERLNRTAGKYYQNQLDSNIELRKKIIATNKAMLEQRKILEDLVKDEADNANVKKQNADNELARLRAENAENEKKLALSTENLEALKKLSQEQESSVKSFFKRFLIEDRSNSLFQSFFKPLQKGATETIPAFSMAILNTIETIKKLFNPLNLLDNVFSKTIESTYAQVIAWDSAINSFERSTGIVGKHNDLIFSAYENNRDLAVSSEDAASSVRSLLTEFKSFSLLSKEQQKTYLNSAIIMEKLGVSTNDYAKEVSILKETLKTSDEGVKKFNSQLMGMADSLGITLTKAVSDFNESMPKLVKRGESAKDVFLKLTAQAKSLRLETSELLDVVAGYDSFDEAVPKVARLNAILGGPYLNTIQMMKMSENERVETLIKMFNASGKVWTALNAQEKQAVANAAGISNMETATKIFTGSLEDYRRSLMANAVSEEEARERAADTASMMEKLQSIMRAFAVVVRPIVAVIGWIADAFLWLDKITHGYGTGLITVGLIVMMFKGKIFSFFSGFIDKLKGLKKPIEATGEVVVNVADKVGSGFSKLVSKIAGALKAITYNVLQGAFYAAASIGLISLAIWGFGKAIKEVDEGFSGLSKEKQRIEMMKQIVGMADYEPKMSKLADSITKVASSFSKSFSSISDDSLENASKMFEQISSLSLTGVNPAMSVFLSGLGNTIQGVSQVKSENIEKFKEINKEIITLANTKINDNSQITELIKNMSSMLNALSNNKSNQIISFEIDGREIGKVALKELNNINPVSSRNNL